MADRLTQLQDCLDDLLTQMYATLSYIQTRHPYGDIPSQPSQAPASASQSVPNSATPAVANGDHSITSAQAGTSGMNANTHKKDERPVTPPPEEPHVFQANMRELARDLILKEQQIEYLIQSLPGIGTSEAEQVARMRELEGQLREVEAERERAEEVKSGLTNTVSNVLLGIKRVPG